MENKLKIFAWVILGIAALWIVFHIVKILIVPAIIVLAGYFLYKKFIKKNNTTDKE